MTHTVSDVDVAPSPPTFEHHRDAFGIGDVRPRLSWQVPPAGIAWRQAGYEIEISDPDTATVSRHVRDSEASVLVPWPGPDLLSGQRLTVRVRVRGTSGECSRWSRPSSVEAGLLEPGDWSADLIRPGGVHPSPVLFRREFTARHPIVAARLYITAQGVYSVRLNGTRVGEDTLAPGWTSYGSRLRYQTYDVTDALRTGDNAIGVTVADGWWRGRLGWTGLRNVFGDRLGLLAQLVITHDDGSKTTLVSDSAWHWSTGPVQTADLYDGETHDARLARPGWAEPGYDETGWKPVEATAAPTELLCAPDGPPVRRTEEIPARQVITTPSGATVLDFGQNLVGRLRIRVTGPAGTEITLRHAEVLENGELGVRPLRSAKATDTYVLRGDVEGEVWEPEFTYHGFRYAEVTGWPTALNPADVVAVVLHTDLRRTGWFECSDERVNQLHDNVVWSMRGNFVDLPTDCPQRDERLGWTGDIQVFAPTASYLYDCAGFLISWLKDLAADQRADGDVPVFIPFVPIPGQTAGALAGQAGWGDAAVIVPWVLYQRFGDLEVLRTHYGSMCAWVDRFHTDDPSGHGGDNQFQLGDWLDPNAPPDDPAHAETDPILVATAYRVHVARLLARIAGLLDQEADSGKYDDLADCLCARFNDEYVTPNGRLVSDSQTAYALALSFGLLSADRAPHAAERLVELVRAKGHRISTGFLGTPLICDALTQAGALDDAYRMLLQTECPSWLYPVSMGATTIWERWDSMLPDGRINPGEMTSFNHYALGAVADWLHRVVGGLRSTAPGFRTFDVTPQPGGGLNWARTAHETPYGLAEVSWRRADGRWEVDVTVPFGSQATIHLPVPEWTPVVVGAGRHRFTHPDTPGPFGDATPPAQR
ncbi:glycoside hydrolase family 78 protein [Amycolatopsis tolypomycina]|uniref:glycoside hydrolase family 78 protein n=1 Tax=Amycolatopsis tolypomycina TaxID=208445 RepID=UPI0033B52F9B